MRWVIWFGALVALATTDDPGDRAELRAIMRRMRCGR